MSVFSKSDVDAVLATLPEAVREQEEIKRTVTESMPYLTFHKDYVEDEEDSWARFHLVVFVAAMKRIQKADTVTLKKNTHAKHNHRYDVVTESPEPLAKARAQAKQAYADMVMKHEERERKQAEEVRQIELARREAIQKQRAERASAPEKPYSVAGPSHRCKDAIGVCETPDALARAKRELEKAAGIESAASHAAKLKAAEEERVASEEAKLELRRIGKAVGGC